MWFVGAVVFYFLFSSGVYWLDLGEVYPFAPWSLYSHVNTVEKDYAVRITAVEGEVLAEPLYFQEASHLFPEAQDVTAQVSMQRLGKAVLAGNETAVAEIREYVEPIYLETAAIKQVEYEVVERRFNPLERWRTGVFMEERVLASFEALGE